MEEAGRKQRYRALQVLFFFFSSRRRHTRLQGDWSSDVCSSDLALRLAEVLIPRQLPQRINEHATDRRKSAHQILEAPRLGHRGGVQLSGDRDGKIGRASCRERV